jgi:tetratricopeptide (TPR) repeat protein
MTVMTNNKPLTATALEALAWKLANQGKMKEAVAACSDLNQQYPDFAAGWHTASHFAQRLNNGAMALRAIDNAVSLEPKNSEWLLQKCYCQIQLGLAQQARPLALHLADAELANAYQYATLGLLLSRLELHEQALHKYQQAIKLQPNDSQHYYNLATLQRFLGEYSAAEASLELAIAINSKDYEAYKLRADLRRQTPQHNHVPQLLGLLDAGIEDARGRVSVLYALAKEQEDLQQYEDSFIHLQQGTQLRRQHMRYDVKGDLQTMARIESVYDAGFFQNPADADGDNNDEAIFILGMPRTGTTLVERILASHSSVTAAGELNNFALQLTQLARKTAGKLSKAELVDVSSGLNFAELGKSYIDSTRPLSGTTPRFIDKMPLNFLYVGLIHRALPQAKIIHLQRHPLDTCYAIYKTLFKDAYPFSYSMEELAQYYLAYRQLMVHWQAVLPGVVHNVSYEALVEDTERESHGLLEYCDLPWEDACLRFYENKEASTTASASQVREPVYRTSVGKWRCYEQQLQPLIGLLEEAGMMPDA